MWRCPTRPGPRSPGWSRPARCTTPCWPPAASADAVVMAAAVADYRPAARSAAKIKKDGQPPEPLRLTEKPGHPGPGWPPRGRPGEATRSAPGNHDPETGRARPPPDRASGPGRVRRRDRHRPRNRPGPSWPGRACDLLVVNPVGNGLGFGTPDNEAGRLRRRRDRRADRARPPRKRWPTWYGIWSPQG